jgi:hypothetical protein
MIISSPINCNHFTKIVNCQDAGKWLPLVRVTLYESSRNLFSESLMFSKENPGLICFFLAE